MIEEILLPIAFDNLGLKSNFHVEQLGHKIQINTGILPEIKNAKAAIIGVTEGRGNPINTDTEYAPDVIRRELYKLYFEYNMPIIDLGNIEAGHNIQDTISGLSLVLSELIADNVVPIILGGSQILSFAQFKAYVRLERFVNIAVLDAKIDFGQNGNLTADNFLYHILTHDPNYTVNFSHLCHQTYFTDPQVIQMLDSMYFDGLRLGDVQHDIQDCEPLLRNVDMVSIDMNAIRRSDQPAHALASPHGLYGEQACTLARYAGIGDKISSIGFYELNPSFDIQSQGAQLTAQMIWHFLQGLYYRKPDNPEMYPQNYLKYIVTLKNHKHEMIFYKNKINDRWWMELPLAGNKYMTRRFVPCAYKDYLESCQDTVPEKWIRNLSRMF